MSMSNPTNLELLRLATELAYADYNNRRANIHNQWLADNEKMMKMYRTSVPYPTIPPYPTEMEIIAKAKQLIEFLNMPRPDLEKKKLQPEVRKLVDNDDYQVATMIDAVDEKESSTLDNIPDNQPTIEKPSVIEKIKKAWR